MVISKVVIIIVDFLPILSPSQPKINAPIGLNIYVEHNAAAS